MGRAREDRTQIGDIFDAANAALRNGRSVKYIRRPDRKFGGESGLASNVDRIVDSLEEHQR